MRSDIEQRIRRQEQRIASVAPEEYGIAMRQYCETGEFPENTPQKVRDFTLKSLAFAQAIRDGMGISRSPRIPFPQEETDGA
jgi:hypothetical protein